MRYVLDHLIRALEEGQSAVLGAIIRSSGSAPRTSGARMLVLADGTLAGSVGGGALEGACQAKAHELFRNSCSFAELNFNLNAATAAEAGMLCGGSVSVLLHQVEPAALGFFQLLRSEYLRRLRPIVVTMLPRSGSQPLMVHLGHEEGVEIPVDMREEILRKVRRVPFLVSCGDWEGFVEPLIHPEVVHLVGAGHVALATAHIAVFSGFEVVVMDDRAEFANSDRYPQAKEVRVLTGFDRCINGLGPDDYVIIVTRGHLHDREVLAQALRTDAGYIGMIGSRRKRDALYASLSQEGFKETDFSRVHCPIGLAIGADTPEEIALSIVAELVQARSGMDV